LGVNPENHSAKGATEDRRFGDVYYRNGKEIDMLDYISFAFYFPIVKCPVLKCYH